MGIGFTDEEIKALTAARIANYEAEARALKQQWFEEGYAKGFAKGYAKGRAKAKLKLIRRVRKGLRQGYSVKTISDITGFSMTKLERLAAKIKLQTSPES